MKAGTRLRGPARAVVAEASAVPPAELDDPRRAAQRMASLLRVTSAFAAALTREEASGVLFAEAGALLGAGTGNVCILEDDTLELVASHGMPEALMARWRRFTCAAGLPASDAARSGEALFLGSPEAFDATYPALSELRRSLGNAAWASLPLVANGRTIGVMGLGWRQPRAFDDGDRAFLAAIAGQCAMALERARLYEAERAARARAEAAEEEARRVGALQERLMAVVGHDLRTPLQAVALSVQVLLLRGGLNESQAALVARVASSAARMNGIIRDLLDFTRARQGGALAVTRAPVDAAATFQRAVLELQQLHPDRRISFRASGDLALEADAERLLQVASNLVGNALQHGPPWAAVSVEVEGSPDAVALRVHNEGPPIPADALAAIFEPFRRGRDASAAEDRSGSIGLGLFIVREIVRAHGGEVACRSAEGQGTTFSVRLPRR